MYQVIPFMTHLELNHIKDDKVDSERAHKGQEAVKLVNAGLQPQYKGRFKLQVEHPPSPTPFCGFFSFDSWPVPGSVQPTFIVKDCLEWAAQWPSSAQLRNMAGLVSSLLKTM